MSRFAGQVALVTGASSGVGRAIAIALAREGAHVVLAGRNRQALCDAAREAGDGGGRATWYEGDLTADDAVEALASRLAAGGDRLDLLVHSAGALAVGPVEEVDVSVLDRLHAINVRAPYLLTRRLLPRLRAARGQIVFVNSRAGLTATPGSAPYAATKHALRALADAVRDEVNADGVRVLSIFLGRTATPMQAALHAAEGKTYRPERLIQPSDVAAMLVGLLALPRSAEITDVTLRPMAKPPVETAIDRDEGTMATGALEDRRTASGDRPLVTVGVPVFNGEAFLARTLDALLAQTYEPLEILVVDNGSTDGTPDICRAYAARDARVRVVRFEGTVRIVPNFRRTLALARGRYFAWNAADDLRDPDAIAACVAALERNPQAVMAHGPIRADLVRQGRSALVANRLDLERQEPHARVSAFTAGISHAAMLFALFRREGLDRIHLPDHCAQDYLACLQACLLGEVAYVDTPMLTYRHVWGEIDTPMYRPERITLRDLLVYRGVRRRKCWVTLATGTAYLLTRRQLPFTARASAAGAHVRAFVRRYRSHLARELLFIACQPAAWLCTPFVPAGRRAKQWLLRSRPAAG